jgi:ankyrin repeat protein
MTMKKFLFFLILLSSTLHAAELPPIHQAASEGNIDRVRELLDSNPTLIESRDEGGRTPLRAAVFCGHTYIVLLLLKRGAKAELPPIHQAVLDGNIERVRELLDGNPTLIESWDEVGRTPLRTAAFCGHTDIVRLLLDRGANIEAATTGGWPPLLTAAQNGHTDTVRLLLYKGAKIETANSHGGTPLLYAAQQKHLEIVKLLAIQGANINMQTELARRVFAVTSPEIRLYLTETAPRTLLPTQFLLQAARGNWEELVVASVVEDADITATSLNGNTALHWAAFHGNVPMAKFLILHGAAVNARNIHGDTPLHLAARKQDEANKAMVYGLLFHGADPSLENALHETPVHTAAICPDLMATFVHAARQRREPFTTTHPQTESPHSCLFC